MQRRKVIIRGLSIGALVGAGAVVLATWMGAPESPAGTGPGADSLPVPVRDLVHRPGDDVTRPGQRSAFEDESRAVSGAETARAPAPAQVSAAPAATYTIRKGDTFESIARQLYGRPERWTNIARANPLVDPKRLKVGQMIRLPEAASDAGVR